MVCDSQRRPGFARLGSWVGRGAARSGHLSKGFTRRRMDLGWTQACPGSADSLQLEALFCVFSHYASASTVHWIVMLVSNNTSDKEKHGKSGDLEEGWAAISVLVCAEMTPINGNPWERLNTKVDPLSILPSAFFWNKYSRESWEKVMSALELALWYYFLKIYCLLMAVFQQKLMSSYVVKELGTFVASL